MIMFSDQTSLDVFNIVLVVDIKMNSKRMPKIFVKQKKPK